MSAAGAYLQHLELMSADPARLAGFYDRAMQMRAERLDGDRWICRDADRTLLIARDPEGNSISVVLLSPKTNERGRIPAARTVRARS